MSLALLNRQPVTWDSEAASYLTAVESADSQSLEPAVARAINTFVIDCKIRGIWEAIKSCCLLCGARSLNGALVPLKGAAPTSYNFVSADYNRETGLKGNGSSKYLDSNRASNADSQDNNHISCYVTSTPSIDGSYYIGVVYGTVGTAFTAIVSNMFYNRDGNRSYTKTIGFHGTSRNSSSSFISRVNSSSTNTSAISKAPNSDKYYIFARSVGYAQSYTDARLSFYSIGESIDLRLLEQCVNRFNLNLLYALRYNSSDSDVQNYLSRVEAADNYPLENSIRLAIHNFVAGCKSDNTWNSIKASCIMMGARTLNGALVPLVGNTPGNFNFVNSDYNRKIGIKGNGSNKYLDSNRPNNIDGQNDSHYSIFVTEIPTINSAHIASGAGITGNNQIFVNVGPAIYFRNRSTVGIPYGFNPTGFIGHSRASSTQVDIRFNNSTVVNNDNSQVPNATNTRIFDIPNFSGYTSNARLSFYSIGGSLTLSLLDSRISSLYNTINTIL